MTVSTNMAGRGTDILLGGNPDFLLRDRLEARQDKTSGDPCATGARTRARHYQRRDRKGARGSRRLAAFISLARSATIRVESTTSSWTGGTSGRPRQFALLPFVAGRSAAHLRWRADAGPDAAARHGRRCADRVEADHERIAAAQKAVEAQNFASVNTFSNTTT